MSKCSKYNHCKPSKKRSAAQMQVTALMKSHTTYQHAQNKENIAPLATTSSSASTISNTQLEREKKRKNTSQSRYRNKKRCHERTKSRTNKLQSHLDEARASMTEASLQVVHQNREINAKRKKHREASSAKLAAVVPRVTPDEIAKMRVVDVDLQIRWHRQFDMEVPAAKRLKGKNGPQKKAILTAAVGRYVCGGVRPKIQDENVMDGQQEDAQCAMGDSDDEEGL
ncbi:uncharacterized protein EDB93DRAFT_1250429 [Suillus bovinus]|uniref:uncharacterized protein n=1 Tax=Suillus bovinus TaxID=48563 RepID=UPI001B87D0E6|nr:uncharacterized protein EDB93DRAFT_1250429 [Suillus bovinus]KAG2147715.1 hypothetical protein EDB93DRAFT_1250429 [Suillus bovinus]